MGEISITGVFLPASPQRPSSDIVDSLQPTQTTDQITISPAASAHYKASQRDQELVEGIADIRTNKVNRILHQIEDNGDEYFSRISDKDLAQAILSNPFSSFSSG